LAIFVLSGKIFLVNDRYLLLSIEKKAGLVFYEDELKKYLSKTKTLPITTNNYQ